MEKLQISLSDYSDFLKTKSGQDFLVELSKSKDYSILTQVANCKQTSRDMLMELMARVVSNHEIDLAQTYIILRCIARNPSLDSDGLDAICDYCIGAKDVIKHNSDLCKLLTQILEEIASHSNTSEKTFTKLSTQSSSVLIKMVKNPIISDQMLIIIVETDTMNIVRADAAVELARRLKEKIYNKESND